MRLATFKKNGSLCVGAINKNDSVTDLTARSGIHSIKHMIAADKMVEAEKIASEQHEDFQVDDYPFELPIPDPGRIICVGVNYMNRNAEYKDGTQAPPNPSLFIRSPLSFSAHKQAIYVPPESEQLDYEGEIVLVIGKKGRRIPKIHAHDHIAGLTIMNEGTIRDWVRHAKFNVTQGKNWDNTGGLGPWIETDCSDIDFSDMTVETRVNGETRQKDTTANMAFPFAKIIEYISTFTTLMPGDIIATGTPVGAGARFDPPIWLKAGDVVEVEVEGVGILTNQVQNEA